MHRHSLSQLTHLLNMKTSQVEYLNQVKKKNNQFYVPWLQFEKVKRTQKTFKSYSVNCEQAERTKGSL